MRKIALLLLFSCSCARQPLPLLSQLKDTAQLSTVEISISKLIVARQVNSGLLVQLGMKKSVDLRKTFLANSEAQVEVGIELDRIDPENIKVEGEVISLLLPPVKVLNFSYPPENFVVDSTFTEGFQKGWPSPMDLDDIYQQAEMSIRHYINHLGIKEIAESQTRIFMEELLHGLNYKEVFIEFEASEQLIFANNPTKTKQEDQ